jgi:hypothetical protein
MLEGKLSVQLALCSVVECSTLLLAVRVWIAHLLFSIDDVSAIHTQATSVPHVSLVK